MVVSEAKDITSEAMQDDGYQFSAMFAQETAPAAGLQGILKICKTVYIGSGYIRARIYALSRRSPVKYSVRALHDT